MLPPWVTSPVQPPCGFFFVHKDERCWLPLVTVKAHTTIAASASRTVLTQTFALPSEHEHAPHGGAVLSHGRVGARLSPWCQGMPATLPELRYAFPLYDGVSVVAFSCTINKERTIHGVVRERAEAKAKFDAAVAKGQTAGLLEQDISAGDVFTTTVGNVPAGAELVVSVTYVGELKHDAEVDGLRFTIPTRIAPRYGVDGGHVAGTIEGGQSISVQVDAEMPAGTTIKSIKSPSHPLSVEMGTTSANQETSLSRASASFGQDSVALEKDFVLQIVASNLGEPSAVVETHPTLGTKALVATLVPKFNLPPPDLPEVVFVCDRSGSMQDQIGDLVKALRVFLKSLPVGIRFNICSFGSHHDFLFECSEVYSKETLDRAIKHIDGFSANYGGTEMYHPIEDVFRRRHKDIPLEVFVLTDGEIWAQDQLFGLINKTADEAKGAIRLFSLGVGSGASTSLVEGMARAGRGFAQFVADGEAMDRKVVRMLKAALTAHVNDYQLEVKWAPESKDSGDDEEFELIERVDECLKVSTGEGEDPDSEPSKKANPVKKAIISLFDTKPDPDAPIAATGGVVPSVAVPKIIQAPHPVPPLYPFNRTSVYLLLTGDAARRTPVSVVLRGTSAQGPLSLEIPVTDVGKGETIAQLAARKAVHELEEDRGWVHNATDARSGKLLKDAYDSKFKDLVKAEAVRLGVEYGVGGKWCSFVALEEGDEGKEAEADVVRQADAVAVPSGAPAGMMRSMAMPMMAAMPAPMARSRMQNSPALFGSAASPPPPPPGGSASYAKSAPMAPGFAPSSPQATYIPAVSEGMQLFGAAPGATASFGGANAASPTYSAASPVDESMDDALEMDVDVAECDAAPPASKGSALDTIIELQSFDGSWQWSDAIARAVGIAEPAATGPGAPGKSDFATTCLVLAWLEAAERNNRDSWEMVADKARAWAVQLKGEEEVGKLVDAWKKMM